MTTLLLILVSTALLALLIVGLHKYQQKKTDELADQVASLPPLELQELQELQIPEESAEEASPISVVAGSSVVADTSLVADATEPPAARQPWQEEVKTLRDSGQFQAALSLCRRQYPKALAFRQTMITLRSQIREGDEDPNSLKAIYLAAIQAELAKTNQPAQQETGGDGLPHQLTQAPERYWQEIGYEHLPLLTKTDRKLLVSHWGEPHHHNPANQILGME